MSKHTPVPWRDAREVVQTVDGPPQTEFHIYTVGGPYGHPATCDKEADAEFIVRACNAHDDLLTVLKLLVKDAFVAGGLTDHLAQAHAAIAKAEGR